MSTTLAPEAVFGSCSCLCNDNTTQVCRVQEPEEEDSDEIIRLEYLTTPLAAPWMRKIAEEFKLKRNGTVDISFVEVSFGQLFEDIVNEATSTIGLYDGFITPPSVAGSVVEYDGWADLTGFIRESSQNAADWSDILLGYRQWVAQYEDKVIMYPLDGDLLSLFFRKDVLSFYNLTVPRTWDEYNQVASFVHGREFEGETLTGSCVGRQAGCAGAYWANMVISGMTQTNGPSSGHLFDTADLTPLTGPALIKALELMEDQAKYGIEDEFYKCITPGNSQPMKDGTCVLTYNWGFKTYLREPTNIRNKLGVAPTPGSRVVLDRITKTLVDCDAERCPHGDFYDDIGWVNRAPYMAFGGWACAVNNYTTTGKKRLATEFCAFASSEEESIKSIIPNAFETNTTINGQDPYRRSHLDLDKFTLEGYDKSAAEDYISAIQDGLNSPNVVTDIKFPTAADLYQILDTEFRQHLNQTTLDLIPEEDRNRARADVVARIDSQWIERIAAYNTQSSTQIPVLDTYQRLRGVYSKRQDLNHIDSIRFFGYTLAGISLFCSFTFAIWTMYARKRRVVQASQPFFLVILCIGGFIFSFAIYPLGIDDSVASAEVAGAACMSVPWLLALGWTILFAALFAKLWRVNMVFKNSIKFRRVQVSVKDVMLPFAILLTWNITLLLIWTIWDPLFWRRIETSDTSSYGTCSADTSSHIWKVCAGLIAFSNGLALILANVEAYRARHIATEFGESKYIAMAMGSILQVTLVGLPLIFLVNDNPSASYFVRSSIVFVVTMSILTLVFIPKIYIWFTKSDRKKRMRLSATASSFTGAGDMGMAARVMQAAGSFSAGSTNGGGDTALMARVVELENKLMDYEHRVTDLQGALEDSGADFDSALMEDVAEEPRSQEQSRGSNAFRGSMRRSFTQALTAVPEGLEEEHNEDRKPNASRRSSQTRMIRWSDESTDVEETDSSYDRPLEGSDDRPLDAVECRPTISVQDEASNTSSEGPDAEESSKGPIDGEQKETMPPSDPLVDDFDDDDDDSPVADVEQAFRPDKVESPGYKKWNVSLEESLRRRGLMSQNSEDSDLSLEESATSIRFV